MGFGSVYRALVEIFPQIDTRILKAVAIEHSKDADEAAAVVLLEIVPTLPSDSSHDFNQSQNKSKRERQLERELKHLAAGFRDFPIASDSKSSGYSSSSGTYPMRLAPSTGFHVASDSMSSGYSSSSRTIPMGLAPSYGFNAPSTDFHVASDSKSSAYASSSGTIPSVVELGHYWNTPSTGFPIASDSKSSGYASSSGMIPSVVDHVHYLNTPSTGFHVASDSMSSAYSPFPTRLVPSSNFNAPSTGFHSMPSPYSSFSRTTPPGVGLSYGFNAPATGFHVAPDSMSSAYSSSSRTIPMDVAPPSYGFNAPSNDLVSNRKELTNSPRNVVGRDGFVAPGGDIEAILEKCFGKEEEESKKTMTYSSSGTIPMGVPFSSHNSRSPSTDLVSNNNELTNPLGLDDIAVPCEAQIGLNESEDDDTASVVSPVTKEHIEPSHGFWEDIEFDTNFLAELSISKGSENAAVQKLVDLPNQQELAEKPNQLESEGELMTPNVQLATTSAEVSTSIGSENAAEEKLVDSTTLGDNTMNMEEDSCFEHVPESTNVVDETSNGCNVDHLEEIIEDAKSNKKALTTAMESVTKLMREVEIQEKDAEKAKEEAGKGGLDTLEKVEELKKMLKHAKEANDMHAGEVYGEKSILATEVKELENRLLYLSDERNKSLSVLDEMRESLEVRLEIAMEMKKIAEEEKKEREDSAVKLLAEQEALMEKVVEESKLLQQEADENSKLREFLMDRGQMVDSLQGEISVICQDVKVLKEKFENRVSSLNKSISSLSETSSRGSSISEGDFMVWNGVLPESLSIDTILPAEEEAKEKNGDYGRDLVEDGWDIFDKDLDF